MIIKRLKRIIWIGALTIFAIINNAHASVTCNFSSNPGFSTAYVPTDLVANIRSTTFAVTCTRTASSGGATSVTVSYSVAASNGLHVTGTQNRGASGTHYINYSVSTDPACSTPWKGTTYFTASFPLAKSSAVTNTYTYYGCIPALQAPSAGTYTDTVTTSFAVGTVSSGGSSFSSRTFPVSIVTPSSCSLTTLPGNITFNYTSFSGAAVLGSTTFGVTCTNILPYTISLDAFSGTIVGVNYSLALSGSSGTGTGTAQTYTINGTVASGQAGTCSTATCSGSNVRTLTIVY